MAILWAPIFNVSFERRLQVFSAFLFFVIIYFGEVFSILLFISFVLHKHWLVKLLCILYLGFFYLDRKAHENGSRGQGFKASRDCLFWRYFTSYFPMKLVKTAELPPNKNYLFAAFPHGLMSVSCFGNFASSTTNFHELFPKMRSKFCTLKFHFFVPLFRELFLSCGMISVESGSIKEALLQSNDECSKSNSDGFTANAAIIAVGGSQEVVHARPGNYHIVLKDRKGFIKIAIQTGASLVPVFSFGEIDIYNQPPNEPGSKIRAFQELFKKIIGITPPIVNGRGFFQYSFGLIPRRSPITTVVGFPIEVAKNPAPTDEDIKNLHDKFADSLRNLFEQHKNTYAFNTADTRLIIE